MEKTKTSTTIVECAILIAMAFALSFIKIIDSLMAAQLQQQAWCLLLLQDTDMV